MGQAIIVLAFMSAVTLWASVMGVLTVTDATLPAAPRYIGGVALIIACAALGAATVALAHAGLS